MKVRLKPKQGDAISSIERVARDELRCGRSESVGRLIRRQARRVIPEFVRAQISEFVRSRFLPYQKHDVSRERWEGEYDNGSWNHLENPRELVRYSAVIGYYNHYRPGGSVLDVGCGAGVLQRRLRLFGYAYYLGIDLSERAIAQAQRLANDPRAEFRWADTELYTPQDTFDVIIFNEVLYYLTDPVGVVQRLASALSPEGIAVISMLRRASGKRIWQALDRVVRIEDAVQVRNQNGVTWDIKIFRRSEQFISTQSLGGRKRVANSLYGRSKS
jgi:2-polyprenyl-3-methyl-5-hydroxy-6-metoxy-1,4-benzoquinol methylase